MACDLRIGSPTALFELPALRLGLLYNPAAVARLWRILPEATMKRLLLAGERLDGREALAAGILTHAAEAGRTLAAAENAARSACAVAPSALIQTKRLLVALADGTTDVSAWEDARRALLGSVERRSALAAATAKRRA
jgi:enoyl-CoA hydratase/carnithine racemase